MNYDTNVKNKAGNRGFIALMATIIISLILLVMVVEEGTSGWYARFNILGTEAKEQANALAEGCADQALTALVTDPYYTGDSTSTTAGGTCHTFPIKFNTPAPGLVTISTQAQVRGSFANLAAVMNLNSVHLGSTPSSPTRGTLIVYTHVVNDNGGAKQASDFTENVSAGAPSKFLFAGSEGGVAVTMNPGAYSISQNSVAGYNPNLSTGCAGTIAAGEVKSCVVTNDDVLTTLTVIANVINDNGGIHPIGDFTLYIDGVAKTPGQPYVVTTGSHTVGGTTFAGYTASAWGYNCAAGGTITINSGDNKTCIITYDDNPPAPPVCADTVMMLDRTGSMSSTDLSEERTAATSLINLYSGVTPLPKIGVGIFGDGSDNNGNAPAKIVGALSTAYSTLISSVNSWLSDSEGSTNLGDAINKANAELNGPNHDASKQKVLVLVSDGEPNRPSGNVTTNVTLAPSASGTYDTWQPNTGAKIAAVNGNDGDTTFISTPVAAHTFGLQNASVPVGASNISVSLFAVGKSGSGSPTMQLISENGSSLVSQGSNNTLGSSYATSTWSMSANPLTGNAWQSSEVNNWGATKFGVLNTSSGSAVPRVTQVYGSVTYSTPASTPAKGPATAGNSSSDDWSNATRAFTNDGQYATDNRDGDRQRYSNFGFAVPSNATVTGIEVDVEAKSTDSSGCEIDVDLSSNNSSFGSNKTISLTGSDAVTALGNSGDTWGDSWSPSEVNGSNFAVRLEYVDTSSCNNGSTDSVDYVQAKIFYTVPGSAAILPVTSAGNYGAWTPNTGTALAAVGTQNGDTSYISSSGTGSSQQQSFLFPGANIPTSGISNITVTLHAVAKETNGSNGNIQFMAEKGGAPVNGTSHSLSGSYTDYTWQMNTNPTGGSWTAAEVNAWTTKFGVTNTSTGGTVPRISQMYLVVSYSTATDPTSYAYAAADAAKLSGTSIFTIHFGDSSGRDLLAKLASGTTPNGTHQPGSFSDPGGVVSGSTGYVSPTAQAADTGGDNNGFETNATSAFSDGNGYASNNNGDGDRHRYYGYNLNVPPGATVSGIQVRLDWWLDSTSGTNSMGVELSWDAGAHWTTASHSSTDESTNSSNNDIVGGSSDTWGRVWAPADFSPANFRVRLTSHSTTATRDFFLDWVPVQVSYTVNQENGDGDNFFIAPTAADMNGLFQFIGSQVCPASSAPEATPPPTTATLLITTVVVNDNGTGNKIASDFTANVSATNASQTSFAGSTSGVSVTVDPGSYSVTETGVSGYTQKPSATCSSASSGQIVAGETRVCTLVNDDIPPPPAPPNLTITTGSFEEVPDPQ